MTKPFRLAVAVIAAAVLLASVVGWYTSRPALPGVIRIAAGKPDGLYHLFAQRLAAILRERTGLPVHVLETAGTEVNVGLLRDREAELAIIQTDCLGHEGIAGIAPLFPEPLHLIVRKNSGLHSVADLAGRRVALGSPGSGMRQNALTLLSHYGVRPDDLTDVVEPFAALAADPALDAAFVTTGWMNPLLLKQLQRRDWELAGIAETEGLTARYPWFTATTLPRGLYPGKSPVPAEPVPTVTVMALLVGRSDVPDQLVREALAALYEKDLRAAFPAALSAKAARAYDSSLMHPEVANYHNPSEGLNRLSFALDFFSKSKELLIAVLAVGVLTWDWFRRRREHAEALADREQKQQLETFIQQTLEVELAQMDHTDPEALRPFLRQVTRIKQEALRQLTSERVRGDQLFAIFLAQCAALSEKIQMRMMYGRLSEPRP
jgi:uncharacterized protein